MILPLSLLHRLAHALYRWRGFRSRALVAGGREVHLYDRPGGGAGPPALLVHGIGGNAYSFTPMLGMLTRACRRVVLLELPGHGRSRLAPGQEPATALECASVVGAALRDLGEPAVLIGNSLGGALCLHAAIAMPRSVLGVVGLSPAGAPLRGPDRENVLRAFRGGVRAAMEMNKRLYNKPPRLGALFLRDLGRHWGSSPVQRLLETLREDEPGIAPELLQQIAQPVLIFWGASDGVLPRSSVGYFEAHLKNGKVELLESCGHLPQLEQHRHVSRRVEEFIAGLAA